MTGRATARGPKSRGKPNPALRKIVRPARSAHERQAEESAMRFSRGESHIARHLTPASASAVPVSASVAHGLPRALRCKFETAFDADLDRLQLHTDAAARTLAQSLGARAFTAGASIYFARGAPLEGADGEKLLAHEIAHALQQTGRATHGGRMRLEPAAAGGEGVQRDPDPDKARALRYQAFAIENIFKTNKVWQPSKDATACGDVIDRRLKAFSDDALVQKYGAQLKSAVDGKSIEDATTAVDDALRTLPGDDQTAPVKALFFDAYKALNADSKAIAIVGKDVPQNTAFASWSFYESQRRRDSSWVSATLKSHPVAGKYFLGAIVAVARVDFYGPTRGGLDLDPGGKFNEKMSAAFEDAKASATGLIPDERTAVALAALLVFNKLRLGPFEELARENKDAKSLIDKFINKVNFIKQYEDPDFLPNLVLNNTGDPEVLAIAKEAGAAIAPIAKRAGLFWNRVIDVAKHTIAHDANAPQYAGKLQDLIRNRLPALKPLAGVEKRLLTILRQATALSSGHVPSPAELALNFSAAARSVETLVYDVDGTLALHDKSIKITDLPSADQVKDDDPLSSDSLSDDLIYGFVMYLLFLLHSLLKGYVAPPRKKEEAERIADQDAAVAQLKKIAGNFSGLAGILGYSELRKAANAVEAASQPGLKKSYIALLAPFEQVPATLQEFQHDFPDGPLADSSLSGRALIEAVFAVYYEDLLGKLNDALKEVMPSGKVHEFDYTLDEKKNPAVINTALKAVEASFHPPRKYLVPKDKTVLYVRPEDDGNVLNFVPQNNPARTALIRDDIGKNEDGYVPGSVDKHADGFVAWVIPDLDRLVDKLKDIPGLDQITTDGKNKLGKPSDYSDPLQWLAALNKAAANDETIRKQLKDAIDAWLKKSLSDLDEPLRRATNNERGKVRPLIASEWEKLTKRFLDDPKSYYAAPKAALEYMLIFAANIQPARPDEQRLQMTGLLLELALVLSRKLGESTAFGGLVNVSGTDRLDIVLPLYAHVAGAAKLAGDAANFANLKTLNLDFPEAVFLGRPVSDSDIRSRAATLHNLADSFKKTAEAVQEEVVMEGVAAERMLHIPDRGHPLIAKANNDDDESDDTFLIGGVVYQLLEVQRDFTYEPELMSMGSGIIKWSVDDISNRRLWIPARSKSDPSKDQPIPVDAPEVPLFTIMRTPNNGQPEKIVVTSSNTSMLSEITYALDLHITVENLNTLAVVLDYYAQALTTVMQVVFPEFAEEIGAAEIAGSVVQFLGSPEFQMLLGSLDSDAGGLFEKGLADIKSQLTLDALWDYLLFGIEPKVFQALEAVLPLFGRMGVVRQKLGKKSDDGVRDSAGGFRKVFGRLVKLASELIHGFESVEEHISFPVRRVSLFVQGSPWLSLLLRFVANNLYRLEGLTLRELGIEQAADMISEVQQLYLRFETIIAGLGEYQLPDELVPVASLLDMLVNFLFDHLPIKYRLAAKAAKHPLQPLFDWLEKKAAEILKKYKLDPNLIWQNFVAAKVNPYIQSAGKEVSEELEAVLKKVKFLHDLATINVPQVAAQFVDREVQPAETLPKLAPGVAAPRSAPVLPDSGGSPLDAGARARAQTGFGHDFSHVRLHSGGAIDSALRSSGARAATSGSHVYLDSAISAGTAGGRDVLHHELAHVLQQTGARPLGMRHSHTPSRGQAPAPNRAAWRIDQAAERQADNLSRAARTPADAPRSVTPAHGLQPSLADVVAKFFVQLGDPSKLQAGAETLIKSPVREKELGQAAPGLKDKIVTSLSAALKPAKGDKVLSYASPFDAAGEDLRNYVLSNRWKDVADGIPHVLDAGLEEIRPKDKDAFWILVPGRVETALEEFFFGVTGVSAGIEFNITRATGPDGKERKTIDPDNPFKKIRFNYVHLPMIGGTADLWTNIVENSFPGVAKKNVYQANARLVLRGLHPGPGLFTTTKGKSGTVLVFSRKVRNMIEEYVNPSPGKNVPGNEAPKWVDYIKPDVQPLTATGKRYGQIGLRLGVYKDRFEPGPQYGADRASHHTVQWLLIEYLLNTKENVRPFVPDLSLYPSIHAVSGRVAEIKKSATANSGITIAKNEDDRGGKMPTILLSVHTHTLGNVHISPKADDIEGTPPSQGSAIHGEFKKFLGPYADIVKNEKQLHAMADGAAGKTPATPIPQIGGKEATQEDIGTAIFTAACKTYTWMRDHMNDKLERALDDQEKFYYEKLVETATDTTIFKDGKAQPGYETANIGATIRAAVLGKQKDILQGPDFGFEEMTP